MLGPQRQPNSSAANIQPCKVVVCKLKIEQLYSSIFLMPRSSLLPADMLENGMFVQHSPRALRARPHAATQTDGSPKISDIRCARDIIGIPRAPTPPRAVSHASSRSGLRGTRVRWLTSFNPLRRFPVTSFYICGFRKPQPLFRALLPLEFT